MMTIKIDEKTRKLTPMYIEIGYIGENGVEKLEFDIPEKYKSFDKKLCFELQDGTKITRTFDDITSNVFTITKDLTMYKKLLCSIEFFNEENIIAKTSNVLICFSDSVLCTDITQQEPDVKILDDLISQITKSITDVDNIDIDIENNILTIKKKDGTIKTVDIKGEKGEKGDKGEPGKFQVHIVDELPTVGEDGVMYLIKKDTASGDDLYNEYLYADGKWNLIGNTHIDLSDYYMKSETYSIEEVHNLVDEIEAGVELYGIFEDGVLSLSLLDNTSMQLSKIDVEIPQNQELHYTWDGTTGDEAKEIFQIVYAYYRSGKLINVDLSYKNKMYKLTNISNPANKGNELYCQFMTLDYYTDRTDFVFMQSVNAVLTLNGGIVESVSINESIDKFRLIREYDGSNGALPTNNTKEYTPTMPYEPSTKKYVDETQYKNMPGWSSQRTQVLKNINGKPTWVNE